MAAGAVWVVAELHDGRVRASTLELVAVARQLGPSIDAFVWDDQHGAGATLGDYGVGAVHDLGDLSGSLPGPVVSATIAARAQAGDAPDVVLASTTRDGRDVLGRLSARLDRPVLGNAVGVDPGYPPVALHPFGPSAVVSATFTGPPPYLLLLRPRTVTPAEPAAGGRCRVTRVAPAPTGAAGAARVLARRVTDPDVSALDDAPVVVAGGRGVGGPDGFALVRELAELLGGAAGATGAAVDAGWASPAWQIGQTGRTVAPDVYVACGVSGAAQHTVGMRGAGRVVAINSDPRAPIFTLADLGVVGDARQVLRRLIDAVRARREGA